MKKKLFFIIVVVILLLIFIVPKGKKDNVNLLSNNYKEGSSKTAVEYLKEKANDTSITNYNDGNKSEMYTFSHAATAQTPALTDYRYIGDNPNNYVYFNCDDDNDLSTCELWRIIGVFDVEDENGTYSEKIKIVRNNLLSDEMEWNSDGSNYWIESSLNNYLNNNYYDNLSNHSKKIISKTAIYLGALEYDESGYHYGNSSDIYSRERSKIVDLDRNYYTYSNISLMYPSDFGYTYSLGVDDICFNDPTICYVDENGHPERGWIFNSNVKLNDNNIISTWLISSVMPNNSSNDIMYNGRLGASYAHSMPWSSSLNGVRPILYLNSNVIVFSGNGTKNNPYKFSLNDSEDINSNNNDIVDDDNNLENLNGVYKLGDLIEYNGDEYYALYNGDDYVTLMKKEPLTKEELIRYGSEFFSNEGNVSYIDGCDSIAVSNGNCLVSFDDSNIKTVLDNWMDDKLNIDDLKIVNGYGVRVILLDELYDYFSFEKVPGISGGYSIEKNIDTPEWIYEYNIWTMTPQDDKLNSYYYVSKQGKIYVSQIYDSNKIRPVINLKKCSLNSKIYGCENSNYRECEKKVSKKVLKYTNYYVGDEVYYKNEKYYVVNNSKDNSNYVTLFKEKPLTINEVYDFGTSESGNLFVNNNIFNLSNLEKPIFEYSDGSGGISYYNSDTCKANYRWNGSIIEYDDQINVGCYTDYKISDIKKVVDNWAKNYEEDLVVIDGYKARLITLDELLKRFGFTTGSNSYGDRYVHTSSSPTGTYSEYSNYWTMSSDSDNNKIISIQLNGLDKYTYEYGAVKPVININKCALEDGCVYEEVFECDDDSDNNEKIGGKNDNDLIDKVVVTVANTLKYLPQIIIIISSILIVIGLSILGYNYYKSRKERK